MQVRSPGSIESITLPSGFVLVSQESGTYGSNWLKRYGLPSRPGVDICFASSGFNHLEMDLESFRQALSNTPSVLFDKETGVCESELIRGMCLPLGSPGENQVWNDAKGPAGPMFELEKLSTRFASGKPVIRLEGWFRGNDRLFLPPDAEDMGPPVSFISGIYIDTGSGSGRAKVEEVYLQSDTREGLDEFLPAFDQMLTTIKWS